MGVTEEEDGKVKTAKIAAKVALGVLIVAVLVGMWFVASRVADHASQNREDKIVTQAEESASAQAEEEAKSASPGEGSASEDEEITQDEIDSGEYGVGSEVPGDTENDVPAPVPESEREVSEDAADFGEKVEGTPDFGGDLNARLYGNLGDLEYYVGVSSEPRDDLSSCYETTKGYVVCDLGNGYLMIMDTYTQAVFAIAKQDSDLTEEEVSMFQESFESAEQVVGAGAIEGLSVVTKSDPTDLTR